MSDTAAISSLISKIQVAKNYNSKEIRLTIDEADEINAAITQMLIKEIDLSRKVIDLQQQIMNGVEVKQDGGSF